jgi:peptide/nickel transport system substrate-binding protein
MKAHSSPVRSVAFAFVVALGASLLPSPQDAYAQAGAAAPRGLSVSVGPRDGTWKRVFNPLVPDSDARFPAQNGIYEPLIIYNRATGTYMPWLATRYDWSDGNTKLRFAIRPGVKWSDGAAFTAADVAFTFDLLKRFPVLDRVRVWDYLQSAVAVDPVTVEFTFKKPYTPGLVSIGHQPIVAEHKWKAVANPVTFDDPSPVGTGPFTEVLRFEPTVYELGRNKSYWQPGKPASAVLRVPIHHTNDEVVKALEKGELDWASVFIPNIDAGWVAKDAARNQYWYPDFGNTVLLYLNTQTKPFDDPNVRKAVSMAIDRPKVMAEAMSGYAPPADATGLAESQKRWKDAQAASAGWVKHDVAQANKLLDAAGLARGADGIRAVPGGGPMKYEIHSVAGWTDLEAAAKIIAQALGEVGIGATAVPLAYQAWVDKLQKGRFDMGIWSANRGPTPYQFYRGQMDPLLVKPVGEEAAANFQRFSGAEAGPILRRFEASADPAELATLSAQLQKVYVDQAPSLPLFASPVWGVSTTRVYAGFPSRVRPYAAAAPGPPDSLPALLEIAPK